MDEKPKITAKLAHILNKYLLKYFDIQVMRGSTARRLRMSAAGGFPAAAAAEPAAAVPGTPEGKPPLYTDEPAESYRKRLVAEIIDGDPALEAAYGLISGYIDAHTEPGVREHMRLSEARYLQSFKMMPHAPSGGGRLMEVWDAFSMALVALKGWEIERPVAGDFNLETDILPFGDASLDGALLCETLEHMAFDPMHCLIEINRVLKPGGTLLFSVPNAVSWYGIHRALEGMHPSRCAVYGATPGTWRNHIHAREYTVPEVHIILAAAGFGDFETTTMDYGTLPPFVPLPGFDSEHRGETIFCRAVKKGVPAMRYVTPIYNADIPFSGYELKPQRHIPRG